MRKDTLVACVLAMALSACGDGTPQDAQEPAATQTATPAEAGVDAVVEQAQPDENIATQQAALPVDANVVHDRDGNAVPLLPFDIDSVPPSQATLGELPFFSLPEGYRAEGEALRRHARFPFRVGDGLHWVEGPGWSARVEVDRRSAPDKTFSAREVLRNLDAVLSQASAKAVFEGPLTRAYYGPELEDEIGQGFIEAVNYRPDVATRVHVIRQPERNIWVQVAMDDRQAGIVVVEERPFRASAHWGGAFPYLSKPEGYDRSSSPSRRDFDMYPFWTGSGFEEVEGPTFGDRLGTRDDSYSMHEVRRSLDAMVEEAGGRLVFAGRIPEAAAEPYQALRQNYGEHTGYSWHGDESRVYRIDLPGGPQVWVHARLDQNSAGWVVAEREGFVATAALLPAAALKRQLDADGRVAIAVNFAVDEAEILPDSQPQIDQVLALLREDPALRLSVEGHTDDTGDAAHNRALSEARAASVAAALAGGGIDAARLSAAGYGQDRPVADNGSEEGRAKNRRVELVKRQ